MAGSADMQDIKRRLRSVTSIEHITNAMKLVSAAKLRRAKKTFESTQEYFYFVMHNIDEILNNSEDIPSKYLEGNTNINRTCYVVITSNRGLAGSFNANVIRRVEKYFRKTRQKPCFVCIGSKGKDYFARRGYEIVAEYMAPPENTAFEEVRDIIQPIIELYNNDEIDEVILISTSFISSLEQRVKITKLLPFTAARGRDTLTIDKQVEYEPSVEEVFNYMVPKYVEIMIYGAIVESATCEHAARRIAMENATDNAHTMMEDLNLFYNRARQSAITSELTEIVSGAEAIKG